MNIKHLAFAVVTACVAISSASFADDSDLYVVNSTAREGNPPKVLIIFDNSGSMSTEVENTPDGYDPLETYPASGNSNAYSDDMLYWTSGGIDNTSLPTPDSPSESRRFLNGINGCAESKPILKDYGRFTGYLREYSSQGQSGSWDEVRQNNGANYGYFDCWEDIDAENPGNATGTDNKHPALADGFPINGQDKYNFNIGTKDSTEWNAAVEASKLTEFGVGNPITLYTANYLRWYHAVQNGDIDSSNRSRLEIAKEAINGIITTMPTVDFGLAIFNLNYDDEGERDGGRIVAGIKSRTTSEVDALTSLIELTPAETNTPLCETLYEAFQYFSAGPVTFGNKDSDYHFGRGDKYSANNPARDPDIESSGSYITPLKACPDVAYIIYITDGVPTLDNSADGFITTLTAGATETGDYSDFSEGLPSGQVSYLPALASYMYNNDLVKGVLDSSGTDNKQTVQTFTIGFSSGALAAAPLLKETAKRGGGEDQYFDASNPIELEQHLNDALTSIMAIDSSFTSPSIASNNFDRTQTFDAAYYAMFLPGKGPRWSGNLKKLKVDSSGVLVDSKNQTAIADNGNIKDDACTFWSDCALKDGNKVKVGGAAAMLAEKLKQRTIYVDQSNGLTSLALVSASTLATAMAIEEAEVATTVEWLYGVDVDDDNNNSSVSDARVDIMGDPLHSKPLALNFGSSGKPDIRILLGTNQGLVHMFKDSGSTVDETWAYIPASLLSNVPLLKTNKEGRHSVYGMDASPIAYTETNADGQVTKAYVYLGMRRGGSSYYALDISSPDSPKYMWAITPESSGFSLLGQTWSEPVVTSIPGHVGPVLIFGGGYNSAYDSAGTPESSMGEAVYIVDAVKGTLIHSFTAEGIGGTEVAGMSDSIATSVAVLDSNNDGDTDRIYATDVGGNVWRMDLPSADKSKWSAYKFADLGGDTNINDRRFFAEAAIAQTVFSNISTVTTTIDGESSTTTAYQNIPYDAVVIGSGNRPNPTSKTAADMFFVLQDRNVVTKTITSKPAPITWDMLYDVTSASPDPDSNSENIAFGQKLGWFYEFSGPGEKSLTAALIVDGNVYFTSFVPPAETVADIDNNVCGVSGQGRLYIFGLHKGTRTSNQLYYELGERVPDTPQIVIPAPESGEDPYIYIIGVGKGEKVGDDYSGTINIGAGLGVNKIYYHINE
ncbi:rRNA (guanine-N1)-methyltransferase [Shewanella sp. KX20019]|uniref:pilus assembly protein n=1 Tax=Shewanella sp. KX20019 TaxID=2803864 RepID=UPI001928F96B|nr:PilC/PilY family type IV pilus protein [Shewanella sp. KX20019]QQX81508.1 rRNA (guanine-N1)-methyltransferase [Shewanella sp. KX20019]